MKVSADPKRNPAETKQKLVDATVRLMVRQGFAATTVDQICAEARLTKGSFFHYFESKELIGIAALNWWGAMGTGLYAAAWSDPKLPALEQLHRFFDIMTGFAKRTGDPTACMVGMLSQEMAQTHPVVREACAGHLTTWTENTRKLLIRAKAERTPKIDFDPAEVAWYLNSLWQGSMLVAKALGKPQILIRNLELARSHIDSLFGIKSVPKLR
jgi:TetR/AcrR family transcriptional repressor of nem operon